MMAMNTSRMMVSTAVCVSTVNDPAMTGTSGGKYVRVSSPPAARKDCMAMFTPLANEFHATRAVNRYSANSLLCPLPATGASTPRNTPNTTV